MGSIKLAANLISTTEVWANWGHLQIVNTASGQEIEVQNPINMLPDDPNNIPNFLYRNVQSHSDNTSYAPGSVTHDPTKYGIFDIDIGNRDASEFWDVLTQVNQSFLDQTPNYLYGLGQNSNSYAMTLLWMMGVNTSGLLSAVKPAAVTGMTHEDALLLSTAPPSGGFFDYDDLRSWFPGADRNLLIEGYGAFSTPIVSFLDINLTTGDDTFRTGHGDDRVFGNAGDDSIEANGGSDTLSGGSGSDQLFGGDGFDFADYSGGGEQAEAQPAQGIRAAFTVNGEDELVGTVMDSWGDTDQLSGIEFLIGTNQDDRVRITGNASDIFWSTNTQLEANARGNSALGDVLDFSGISGSPGLEMTWDAYGIMEIGQTGFFGQMTVDNFENVIGSNGADTITGDDQANGINGHVGADRLFGGGGDDFLFFDAEDIVVNGGLGRDVAVALGNAGVTVNMLDQKLEVCIGGEGADTFVMRGGDDILFAAGGGGSDTFVIDCDSYIENPRVIWGGAEADDFVFTGDYAGGGIAVVQIDGLTEEMFANLTVEDLNLGGLNLDAFRAIIINPDASDRFEVGGDEFSASEMPEGIEWRFFSSPSLADWIGRSMNVWGGYASNYEFEATLHVERDEFENVLSITDYTGRWLSDGSEEFDFYEYDPNDEGDQDEAEAFIEARAIEPVFRMTELETNPNYGPWYGSFFVVGGNFVGSSLGSNGGLTGSLPDDSAPSPFDWLVAA